MQSMAASISFTHKTKKRGPKILPWGTPHVDLSGEDKVPSTSTTCSLPTRYDLNHWRDVSENPMALSLFKRISYWTVSNSF